MLLIEEDRAVLNRDSVRRVAQVLEIDRPGATSDELRELIRQRDAEAYQVLTGFLEAWNAWYEFHRRIDQNGPRSRLTSEQHTELANLVAARNDTRAALIWKTKQLELRQVTIRIAPDRKRPGNELDLAAKIRRDLYAHGPIEIDPDSAEFSTRRDKDGWASFSFITAHHRFVYEILDRFGYRDKVELIVQAVDAAEMCLKCGKRYVPIMPTVCDDCGFRDISPCPRCGEEIPRGAYIRITGNLHRCPACAARVRLRFSDPLFEPNGQYAQPVVIVEEASE
ncbi:MAG: hypothetical protein ACLQNE_40410 [Thermoguttaceae bacterium]